LQRLAARDSSALAELYDEHSRLLFGLILRILKDRGEAEEVLQEVFVQAWTRASTYNLQLGSPVGWLVGIARNRAIDRLQPSVRSGPRSSSRSAPVKHRRAQPSAASRRPACAGSAADRTAELIELAYFLGSPPGLAARQSAARNVEDTHPHGMLTLRGQLEARLMGQ
jgi:RNA polymerase sigma-70 factor (ECF subfamily)